MRLATLTWPFPFLVRLGWATVRTANPDPHTAGGQAYFLRGQGIVFSRGFGQMCGALRHAGWWAEDLRCVGHLWLARHLIAQQRAGHLGGPLVIVGHSCGGRSALDVAWRLKGVGIKIHLIVCVDVAFAFEVPGNVKRAVHLYRSRGRLYPAGALRAAPGSQATIENVDLDAPGAPLQEYGLNHLNFTSRPSVQAWILQRILRPCTAGCGTQA